MDGFDKTTLKDLREDISTALAEVERKHGIKLELKRITYDLDSFRGTLAGFIPGVNGDSVYESEWMKYHYKYGFNREDLGFKFRTPTGVFKVIGLKTANRKYPVICRRLDNEKIYKFAPSVVESHIRGVNREVQGDIKV